MIEAYQFGEIKINGETYHYDVCLDWKGEILRWQRKESHWIDLEDVKLALEKNPEILIIGTGAYGVAKVSEKVKEKANELNLELLISPTKEAIEAFEKNLSESKKVIGLFHLTC